jgi:hypothetical protein
MSKPKKPRILIDDRKFSIGDLCNVNDREGTFIIQGIQRMDERVIITLGNFDTSKLIQFTVDSFDVEVISLKINITLPFEGDQITDPIEADIDEILSFFKRTHHTAFRQSFIDFCKLFGVDYEHARPLLLSRVFSWDLHTMFDKNEKAWKIPRTGRMYVERSLIDDYATTLGVIPYTYKPKVVSSEVAMLTHQRKIIEALVDASPEKMEVLRMTPPSSSRIPNAFSRKKDSSRSSKVFSRRKDSSRSSKVFSRRKDSSRSSASSSRKTLENEGYGMIDFQGEIAEIKKVVGSGQPVKLRVVSLGGRVIGAHKNQVTDINLLNHGFEALMKRRRIVEGVKRTPLPGEIVRKHLPQPVMSSEIDTLGKLSLVQVIPSTQRFNMQHFTDQLIPADDKMSQDAYKRMAMCILANEYLTDVNLPLADVFDIEEPLMDTFTKLVFSVMYSDLELRLQTPQDMEGYDRSTRGDARYAFIDKVSDMNKLRIRKSIEMKEIEMFNKLFDECEKHLSKDDKDEIENEIRDFFRKKLTYWGIHMIESVSPPKEGQPSLSGSIASILSENPGMHPSELLKYSMTPAQQAAVLKMAASVPLPASNAVRGIQEGDKFIFIHEGVIKVTHVDDNHVWFIVESTGEHRDMPIDVLTDKQNTVPYPNIKSIYQSFNRDSIFRVIRVNSANDIIVRISDGTTRSISFGELSNAKILEDYSYGAIKRPTKKRRHKRRNTRKGG